MNEVILALRAQEKWHPLCRFGNVEPFNLVMSSHCTCGSTNIFSNFSGCVYQVVLSPDQFRDRRKCAGSSCLPLSLNCSVCICGLRRCRLDRFGTSSAGVRARVRAQDMTASPHWAWHNLQNGLAVDEAAKLEVGFFQGSAPIELYRDVFYCTAGIYKSPHNSGSHNQ